LDAAGRVTRAEEAKPAQLYTYRAICLRVIDGDTIWFHVRLRHRQWLKKKVRLRGLDCPEMDAPAGRAAKRFTETLLAQAKSVVITTSQSDKYDRYFVDVHIETAEAGEIHLNNALLENGQARPTDKYPLEDWEKDTGGVPA
jgi:micrococcal nuclease